MTNCKMPKLIAALEHDKEIQSLLEKYELLFGTYRPFAIWQDGGIEGYRDKLRKSIIEKKPY